MLEAEPLGAFMAYIFALFHSANIKFFASLNLLDNRYAVYRGALLGGLCVVLLGLAIDSSYNVLGRRRIPGGRQYAPCKRAAQHLSNNWFDWLGDGKPLSLEWQNLWRFPSPLPVVCVVAISSLSCALEQLLAGPSTISLMM
jgi:hypothetical protein